MSLLNINVLKVSELIVDASIVNLYFMDLLSLL